MLFPSQLRSRCGTNNCVALLGMTLWLCSYFSMSLAIFSKWIKALLLHSKLDTGGDIVSCSFMVACCNLALEESAKTGVKGLMSAERFKVDLHMTMSWSVESWNEVTAGTIRNYWRHSHIRHPSTHCRGCSF